ncbi:hypothetical protein GCK32_003198 [Trichostrongylus colubriformis]|uniref:G-protein coupled receptors family 1 profile domain-containing protein n=1 Tax=Trichostrongylus colubriformis TaxID=6319 RepID=A0AAN8IQX8_TRICO
MVIGLRVYVLVASIPPILYAAFILSINVFMIYRSEDDPKVKYCNPVLSLEPLAKDIWTYWNIFLIIIVLCMQAAIYLILRAKDASSTQLGKNVNQNDDKNRVPCILVLMSTFTCTWGTFMLSQAAVSWMQSSEATVVIQTYSVIFALMTYSMNFYIYFAKHDAYREAFLEQWLQLMPARYRPRVSSYLSSQPTSRTNLDQDVAHSRSRNPSICQYVENLERDMSKIESQKI